MDAGCARCNSLLAAHGGASGLTEKSSRWLWLPMVDTIAPFIAASSGSANVMCVCLATSQSLALSGAPILQQRREIHYLFRFVRVILIYCACDVIFLFEESMYEEGREVPARYMPRCHTRPE